MPLHKQVIFKLRPAFALFFKPLCSILEVAGKPASMYCMPAAERLFVISSFCSTPNTIPGACSPSRSVKPCRNTFLPIIPVCSTFSSLKFNS